MVAHPHIGYARHACAQKTSPRRRRQALSGGAGLLGAEEAPRASTHGRPDLHVPQVGPTFATGFTYEVAKVVVMC